jgi:predicted O-methyltransferase YrrM
LFHHNINHQYLTIGFSSNKHSGIPTGISAYFIYLLYLKMNDIVTQTIPPAYEAIEAATAASGFTMASDIQTCSLLRTIAAAKPGGKLLELGTGTGLSTAWILDGMRQNALLVSIDHAPAFLSIAKKYLGQATELQLIESDGADWLQAHLTEKYDFIFADTWHGKYLMLEEVLNMLSPGAFYIIDDMLPQPNWPSGHAEKAAQLIQYLDQRTDLVLTRLNWATGIIIAVKQ